MKKENEELRSKCGRLEDEVLLLTSQLWPPRRRTTTTRDTGVQCDLCCSKPCLRNSLPQQEDVLKREDLQNQQLRYVYGSALVNKHVSKDVPDSVSLLENGKKVDYHKLPTTGWAKVEESEQANVFNSSYEFFTLSLSLSPDKKTTTDHTSDPSTVVCQIGNDLPTLHQSPKGHSVPPLSSSPQNAVVSASTLSAVVTSKTLSNSATKGIVLKSKIATCTRSKSRLQCSLTSISPVEASNDGLYDAHVKKTSETKCTLSQERASPKERVSLLSDASTLTIIKTEAVWTPPILEASKSPTMNDKCLNRMPTKWTARAASLKFRLVTRKPRPPSTQTISSLKASPAAPRTIRHRGTSHPTPGQSPSKPFALDGKSLLRNQCEQCGRVLSSKAALQKHISCHSRQQSFSCTLCAQRFPDSKALSRHGKVHSNGTVYSCPQCNEGFAYRFGLIKHLELVHSRKKTFVCHICHKGYITSEEIERHIQIHNNKSQFPCKLCDKRFNRRVGLDVHLRSHSREKMFVCPYCGMEFQHTNNLKRHKHIHTGERRYPCPHCTKRFVQSGHLKRHLRNVHKVDVYSDSQ